MRIRKPFEEKTDYSFTPLTFMANSCARSPAHTGCVWQSTRPGMTLPRPPRSKTRSARKPKRSSASSSAPTKAIKPFLYVHRVVKGLVPIWLAGMPLSHSERVLFLFRVRTLRGYEGDNGHARRGRPGWPRRADTERERGGRETLLSAYSMRRTPSKLADANADDAISRKGASQPQARRSLAGNKSSHSLFFPRPRGAGSGSGCSRRLSRAVCSTNEGIMRKERGEEEKEEKGEG